jgi:hypothetical protein
LSATGRERYHRDVDEWAEAQGYVAFDSSGGFRLPDTSVVGPDASLATRESWEKPSEKERERSSRAYARSQSSFARITTILKSCAQSWSESVKPAQRYVVFIDPYRGIIWAEGAPPAEFDLDFQPLLK